MKTKEEILKMTSKELDDYKWSSDLDIKIEKNNCIFCSNCSDCSDCYDCSNCSNCSDCSDCSNCSNCRDVKGLKYAICNIEFTKKEYDKKMLELNK